MSKSSAELELNKRMDPRVPDWARGTILALSTIYGGNRTVRLLWDNAQYQLREITLYLLVLFLCDGRTRV